MENDPWLSGLLAILSLLFLFPSALLEGSLQGGQNGLPGKGPWRARPELLTSALVTIRLAANLALFSAFLLLFLTVLAWSLPWAILGALAATIAISGAVQSTGIGLGRRHAAGAGAAASLLLAPLAWALWPWLKLLEAFQRPQSMSEGAETAAEAGEEDSPLPGTEDLAPETQEIVKGFLGLDEMTVREIMVPRVDMVVLETGTSIAEAADLVIQHGYSRLPLYEGTIDNVVGLVQAKDLLRLYREGKTGVALAEIARPPAFVPESRKVIDLLRDFWEQGLHLALVVDEHGGIEGLVTMEDVLREIAGEVEGESQAQDTLVVPMGPEDVILDARVSVDYLKAFDLDIALEDVDTVGGYVLAQLGRIPKPGEVLEKDGVTFSILTILGRRLGKIRVARRPAPDEPPDSPS